MITASSRERREIICPDMTAPPPGAGTGRDRYPMHFPEAVDWSARADTERHRQTAKAMRPGSFHQGHRRTGSNLNLFQAAHTIAAAGQDATQRQTEEYP